MQESNSNPQKKCTCCGQPVPENRHVCQLCTERAIQQSAASLGLSGGSDVELGPDVRDFLQLEIAILNPKSNPTVSAMPVESRWELFKERYELCLPIFKALYPRLTASLNAIISEHESKIDEESLGQIGKDLSELSAEMFGK